MLDNTSMNSLELNDNTLAQSPTLHVLCGKLASGKTRLARQIAQNTGAVLFSEDIWLAHLFPGEIKSFEEYFNRSARFRSAVEPHVRTLLARGNSVVLDFAGNSPKERAWARSLAAPRGTAILHHIQASDELCKRRLRTRNEEHPEGSQITTEAEFDFITKYFVAPDDSEGFIIRTYHPELSE
jgi:predicted kinase